MPPAWYRGVLRPIKLDDTSPYSCSEPPLVREHTLNACVLVLHTCDHMLVPFLYITIPRSLTYLSSLCDARDTDIILEQIPFSPTDVSVTVVSGERVEVFFCDPLISSGDIWGFLVQWDTVEDFSNAITGGDTGEIVLVSRTF